MWRRRGSIQTKSAKRETAPARPWRRPRCRARSWAAQCVGPLGRGQCRGASAQIRQRRGSPGDQPLAPGLDAFEALGSRASSALRAPRARRGCGFPPRRVPMYWRCRAPPPRAVMRRASRTASLSASGRSSASSSIAQLTKASPRSCAACAARLRALFARALGARVLGALARPVPARASLVRLSFRSGDRG